MLGSLHGTIIARLDQRVLIEVNGTGYWVHTGSWQPEGNTTCYLYHHIREEASDLYGFPDIPTLALFEQLISVSGIGPKAGLALLSIGTADQVSQAIANQDFTFLTRAPGVGQKAAQKISLELHNKVRAVGSSGVLPSQLSFGQQDVADALATLGYKPADIHPILNEIPTEITALDARIKWVLQQLGSHS